MIEQLSAREQRQLRRLLSDPVVFTRVGLRQDVWEVPEAILRSTWANERTIVKSCHASAKTHTAACAALAWATMYPDGQVICTSPTFTQVKRVIFPEIHTVIEGAAVEFPGYPDLTAVELRLGHKNGVFGLATNRGVRMQGFHGRILFIVDEAMGYEEQNWDAIEGARAGGDVHVLALLNPTWAGGRAHEAFTDEAAEWSRITISAFDTPNFHDARTLEQLLEMADRQPELLKVNPRPYLIKKSWVVEKYRTWGITSPLWESKVMGRFPSQHAHAVIPLHLLEASELAEVTDPGGPIVASIDVAATSTDVYDPGDAETAMCLVAGKVSLGVTAWQKQDPRGEIAAELLRYGGPASKKGRIEVVKVDTNGIGLHLATHLADLGYRVQPVNVSKGAHNPDRFADRRSELWWSLRERLERRELLGLTDDVALSQLSSVRWGLNSRGQILVESKKAARARGVKSPDRGDAVMMNGADPDEPGVYDGDLGPGSTGGRSPLANLRKRVW